MANSKTSTTVPMNKSVPFRVFVVARPRRDNRGFPGVEKICSGRVFLTIEEANREAECQWRFDGQKGKTNPYQIWPMLLSDE